MSKVGIYRKLNEGKKRKLVFQLTSRGFASEVNNMLSAILYCLVYDIEFIIYSRSWSGRNNIDWNDYFLPFCKEYKTIFFYRHSVFNNHRLEKFTTPVRKRLLRNHLDTYDIFRDIRSPAFLNKDFDIPELNIRGDAFHAKKILYEMIYRHSSLVSDAVRAHDNLLHDIKPYCSLHIRRGDKVASASKEAEAIDISMYVKQIKITQSNMGTIFVATDDYRVIEDFRKICPPHWNVITFCKPNATGHIQRQFNNESNAVKKQLMLDLLVDIHFLINAQFFIGTYSSNIGRLIALAKGSDKCYSLDIEKWHPF